MSGHNDLRFSVALIGRTDYHAWRQLEHRHTSLGLEPATARACNTCVLVGYGQAPQAEAI
jgi:hypothetical protein